MVQNKSNVLPFFIFLFFLIFLGFFIYNFIEENKKTNITNIEEKNYTILPNFLEINIKNENITENKNETKNEILNIEKNNSSNLTKKDNYTSTYCFSVLSPKKDAWESIWLHNEYIPPRYYYGNNSYFSWTDFHSSYFPLHHYLFDGYYTFEHGCGCSAMIPVEIKNEENLKIYGINIGNIPEGHCKCDLAVAIQGIISFKNTKSNIGNLYFVDVGYWMGSRPPQPTTWEKHSYAPNINKNKISDFSFEWEFDEKEKKKILKYFELWGLEGKEKIFKSKDNKSIIIGDKFIIDLDENFATLKASLPYENLIENYTNNTDEILKFLESIDGGKYKEYLTDPQIEWLNESMLFIKTDMLIFIIEVENHKIMVKKFKNVYRFSVKKEDNKTKIYAEMNIETYIYEYIYEYCEKIEDICFYSGENNGKIGFGTEELYWELNENISYKNTSDKEKVSFEAGENAKFVPFDIIKKDDAVGVFALLTFCDPSLLYENNCNNITKNYTLSISFPFKNNYKKINLTILKILPEETYYYYYSNRFYPESENLKEGNGVEIRKIRRIEKIEKIINKM